MCFFQGVEVEMYTSQPRLKGDYYQPGETEEQYRKRQVRRRREQRESNSKANASSKAGTLPLVRKVAEQ